MFTTKGVPEPVPDSFPESSRTSLSLLWFAAATPDSVQRARSALASHSAIPRGTNVARMNSNRAIQIAAQRTQGL